MQNFISVKLSAKRKTSHVTLIVLKKSSGIFVNNQQIKSEHFINLYSLNNFSEIINEILLYNSFSLFINGGGVSSQKSIIKYILLKYIVLLIPNLKKELKKTNILFNDTRTVERKVYGHLKSRKKKQYSKR